MARASRHFISGYAWHLTHRCHKREFLLTFAKDKQRWMYWLFEAKKRFGLGAMAMAGGSFYTSNFIVSWPTGEFGGMGLEGAVRLGFKKELEAIEDAAKRQARFEELVALHYEHGKAVNMAAVLEIDDVIDPAETRHWIMCGLRSQPETGQRTGKKRLNIDCW